MKNFNKPHKRYIIIEVDEMEEASKFDPHKRGQYYENGRYFHEGKTARVRSALHSLDLENIHYCDYVVGGRNPNLAGMTKEENDELERIFEKIAARRAKLREAWSE